MPPAGTFFWELSRLTPLNFITGFAGILDDELAGPLNPTQHDYLQRILNGSERMLHLVKNLLDMSRIQAGAFQIACSETAYAPLVEEALASLRPLAADKRIALETQVDGPRAFWLDPERITQVLVNLVENAIKFTGHGGRIGVMSEKGKGSTFWYTLPYRTTADELKTPVQSKANG